MREIADAILLEVAYQHWNVWREYLSARRTDFTPPGREGFLIDQAKQSGIPRPVRLHVAAFTAHSRSSLESSSVREPFDRHPGGRPR